MAETVKDIGVLVSFYAAWVNGNVSNEAVHKEKFCAPVSSTQTFSKVVIDLNKFKSYVISFTDKKIVVVQKGIGQNLNINIAGIKE